MGFNSKSLPDSFRKCIAKEERAKNAILQTAFEVAEKVLIKAEKEMHVQFENWCRVNGYFVYHSRFDRKPTIREGTPDFGIVKAGRIVFVEFKRGQAKLDDGEQAKVVAELMAGGNRVLVSNDVAQAIAWTKEQLEK